MKIFLDDHRTPSEVGLPGEWVIAHNLPELALLCQRAETIECISFDHDLGEDPNGQLYENGKACALFMLETGYIPQVVYAHSQNPVGRQNILSVFTSYMRHFDVHIELHEWIWSA